MFVGFSLGLERVAVTTTDPLFSAMDVADVSKVTTGFSSSLILSSKEAQSQTCQSAIVPED